MKRMPSPPPKEFHEQRHETKTVTFKASTIFEWFKGLNSLTALVGFVVSILVAAFMLGSWETGIESKMQAQADAISQQQVDVVEIKSVIASNGTQVSKALADLTAAINEMNVNLSNRISTVEGYLKPR